MEYRKLIKEDDLTNFEVGIKETNLFIRCKAKISVERLENIARASALKYRRELEEYIIADPDFQISFKPYQVKKEAPLIVKEMAEVSSQAGVGPIAGVAGAIAEYVGRDLLNYSSEVIIENGGDVFLKCLKKRRLGILTASLLFKKSIILEIKPDETPLGICTSSGTRGHSISLGKSDAVVVASHSTLLADVMATSIGNLIKEVSDLQKGIKFAQRIKGIKGIIIIKGKTMGIWGDLRIDGWE